VAGREKCSGGGARKFRLARLRAEFFSSGGGATRFRLAAEFGG